MFYIRNFYSAADYKNRIINLLISSKDFVRLINPKPSTYEEIDTIDVLLGGEWVINGKKHTEQGYIFDYNFADDTTTEDKTFVFVETDIESIHDSIFTDFNLYVAMFTKKSLVRISDYTSPTVTQVKGMGCFASKYANRIDAMCDVADRILNKNEDVKGIGLIEPSRIGFCTIYSPNRNYYGKCLKYHIHNLNERDDGCGL